MYMASFLLQEYESGKSIFPGLNVYTVQWTKYPESIPTMSVL